MKYVYPAVFYKDKTLPDTYSVIFPDVEGAATCGYSLYDAIYMAEDALAGMLTCWEDSKRGGTPMGNKITEPTPIDKVVAVPDEFSSAAFVTLIKADTDAYRASLDKDGAGGYPDKGKTLLMPRYDDDLEAPDTLVKEICRVAGVKFPIEDTP